MTTKRPKRRSVSLVPAREPGDRTGCLNCPIFVHTEHYPSHADAYNHDAEKILSKLRDPHSVRSFCVKEDWFPVDILFVGEAPGRDEDRAGEALVGRSGKMLERAIDECMTIDWQRIGVANMVRCRPPLDRTPSKTVVRACSPLIIDEIIERKPQVIVTLGNAPLEFLTEQRGVTTLHGKTLRTTRPEFDPIVVVACVHPSFVLRQDHWTERFNDALELADQIACGEGVELDGPGDYEVFYDAADVEAWVDQVIDEKPLVAFDTETGALSPFATEYPPLLCFSFTTSHATGVVVPYDHPDSPWCDAKWPLLMLDYDIEQLVFEQSKRKEGKPAWRQQQEEIDELREHRREVKASLSKGRKRRAERRERVAAALRRLFTDPGVPKIAQNEKFDRNHIKHALGVEIEGVIGDTMLTHLTIEDQRGTHGLKTLAYTYTGMGGYELPLEKFCEANPEASFESRESRVRRGSYARVPGDTLFRYAAMDTDVTWRTWHGLVEEPEYLGNDRFRALSERYFPVLSRTLAAMEYAGAQIDQDVVRQLDRKYSGEMEKCREDIDNLPEVRRYVADQIAAGRHGKNKSDPFLFNPGSPKQLQQVLFDYYGEVPIELTSAGLTTLSERLKRLRDKQDVEFDEVVLDAIEKGEWDLFSTQASVLQEYKQSGNPLVEPLLKYREASTLHGTFVKPMLDRLDSEGRVHGNFSIHGTVTGRLSSYDPNLQNIPNKGGGLIKRAYVSRFGCRGLLMQLDYSQIELRVAACWFGEETMIEAYRTGADLHTLTAIDISGLTPDEYAMLTADERKAWRTRAKRVNFGVLYGGGPPALQTTLQKDDVFASLDECQQLIDSFFEKRPSLRRGIDALEREVQRTGYLESFTGRRRRIPEVFSYDNELVRRALRQSINFPIQSGAADMTLMSLCLIFQRMRDQGYESAPILTVHDSIVFDVVVDEMLDVALLAKGVMEDLPALSDEILPGVDWSWLTVPIKADAEVGPNWGQMVEFDPTQVDLSAEGLGEGLYEDGKDGKKKIARIPTNIDELWDQMTFKVEG